MEKILEGKYRSPLRDLDVAKNGSDTFFVSSSFSVIWTVRTVFSGPSIFETLTTVIITPL